jgi:hypothetical protein
MQAALDPTSEILLINKFSSWYTPSYLPSQVYPNQPSVDSSKQAAVFVNSVAHFSDVIDQPPEFECTKISADGKATMSLQEILVSALHF